MYLLTISGDFWDFVYSNKWQNFNTLRIHQGRLMKMLMTELFMAEKHGNLKACTIARNDTLVTRVKIEKMLENRVSSQVHYEVMV